MMNTLNDFLLVLCTCPKDETADLLANKIINSQLGACVNKISGVRSTFIWDNKLDNSEEDLLLIKTNSLNYEKLSNLILKEHPYDCPEIIALPIIAGHKDYLSWINKQCLN